MNLLKVSIIVPIYNAEYYLNQCLDSVSNQTFTDFECICIDDGSTDNSLSILQEYTNKDKRFSVITQKNQKLANTRNNGLKSAIGKYIVFIDSDDWVTPNYVEVLYNSIEKYNCDVISSDAYFYNSQTKKTYLKRPQEEFYGHIITSLETKKKLLALGNIWACWGKIYKKEFLIKNNFFFQDYPMEDILFIYEVIIKSSSIMFIKDILYFYRKNIETSLTYNSNDRVYAFIILFRKLKKTLIEKNQYMTYKQAFFSHTIKCFAFELEESKLPLKTLKQILLQIKKEFLDEKVELFYPDNIFHKGRILIFQFCLKYTINYAIIGKLLKKIYFFAVAKQN